jgi:hypothetical protein
MRTPPQAPGVGATVHAIVCATVITRVAGASAGAT